MIRHDPAAPCCEIDLLSAVYRCRFKSWSEAAFSPVAQEDEGFEWDENENQLLGES